MGRRRTILSLVILLGLLWLVVSPFLGGVGAPEVTLWLVVLAVVIVAAIMRRRARVPVA